MFRRLAIYYLVFLVIFDWGVAVGTKKIFPWKYIDIVYHDLVSFVEGNPFERRSLAERLMREAVHDPFSFSTDAVDFPQDIQLKKLLVSSYRWILGVLVKFRYPGLGKRDKGVVIRCHYIIVELC